jgi:hypothetical protein
MLQLSRVFQSIGKITLLFLLGSCSPQQQLDSSEKILNYVYSQIKSRGLCNDEFDYEVSKNISKVYEISSQQYLVELLCFSGAYQGNYEYFLYDKNGLNLLNFDIFEVGNLGKIVKTSVNNIGGLPEYNNGEKELILFTKYRGLGDCGAWAKYKFDRREFKLLEYRIKANCDGNFVEPEQYSQVYPY